MECQWPQEHECRGEVVAKVGLPYATALWVCVEGFHSFQGNPQCPARVGGATGVRCKLREGHEGSHRALTTVWARGETDQGTDMVNP